MIKSISSRYINYLLITSVCLVAVTLPWSIKLNGFFLILSTFFAALHIKKMDWKELKWSGWVYILALALYYLLHVVSLLYTTNLRNGLSSLEKKWVFLLLPLCIAITSQLKFPRELLLRFFCYSVLLATIVALVLGVISNYNYNAVHDLEWSSFNHWFFSYKLLGYSIGIHPAYLSCYVSLVIFYLITQLIIRTPSMKKAISVSVLVIYFLFYLVLLSSRNILATTLLFIFILGIGYVLYTKRIKILFIGIGVYILIFLIILSNDITRGRIMETFDIGKTNQQWGNISLRLQEWDASLDIFRDNFLFGVGPGDFKDKLVKRYESKGWTDMAKERFDSHNQFIQTLSSLGILGFLVLTVVFMVSVRMAIINRDLLFVLFLASFILFSVTESTLEVQKGIVFFTFFNSFFFFSRNTTKSEEV